MKNIFLIGLLSVMISAHFNLHLNNTSSETYSCPEDNINEKFARESKIYLITDKDKSFKCYKNQSRANIY